jgi:serine/threonine-protein kinase SRPK3
VQILLYSRNSTTKKYVALKIVKSASHYTEAAMDEIKFLQALAKGDVNNDRHVVTLLDTFEHKGPHGKRIFLILRDKVFIIV